MSFKFSLDYETSEHAGAGGMFQVVAIYDGDDNEITQSYTIDEGRHYHNLKDVIRDMGYDPSKVDYEEI